MTGHQVAASYRVHVRALWREDRTLFLDLLELVAGSDVTLVDEWGQVGWAPRNVFADVLRVLAMNKAAERARQQGSYPKADGFGAASAED